MTLDVPIRMNILRVVFLNTTDFDLFETPLWQDSIGGAEIAPQLLMAESEARRERMNPFRVFPLFDIIHHLDLPIIPNVTNRGIPIARNLVVEFRNGRQDGVRVEVAACGRV